jgi:hypothetical protein
MLSYCPLRAKKVIDDIRKALLKNSHTPMYSPKNTQNRLKRDFIIAAIILGLLALLYALGIIQ